MGIPHTAAGIFTFVIVVGWLISLLPIFHGVSPLQQVNDRAVKAQDNIINAGNCLGGTGVNATNNTAQVSVCSGEHWYDVIWSVLTIINNILVIIFSFLVGISLSMVTFVAQMLGLPFIISEIVVTIFTVGGIFALIKVIIPDR